MQTLNSLSCRSLFIGICLLTKSREVVVKMCGVRLPFPFHRDLFVDGINAVVSSSKDGI